MNRRPAYGIDRTCTAAFRREADGPPAVWCGEQTSRRSWLVGTTFAAVASALDQTGAHAASSSEDAPNVFPLDEPPFHATLWGVDAEGHVTLRTGDKLRVLAADELAYYGHWQETDAGPQVFLTDGSCLRADLLSLDDQRVVIGDASAVGRTLWLRCELLRHSVRAVVPQPPAGPQARDHLVHQVMQAAVDEDRVWLVGGGSLSGRLQAWTLRNQTNPPDPASEVEVLTLLRAETGQSVTIPLPKVRAVTLRQTVPSEVPSPPTSQRTTLFWLGLTDGSLVQVRELHTRRDPVQLVLAAGGTLSLPAQPMDGRSFWSLVTYLEPVHGRVTWLSDLEPVGYKHLPFLGAAWPLARDRSVLGGRLRTADAAYRKGLAMPSASRVAYDTAGHRWFQAELAVDAAAGLWGSVVYKVLRQRPDGTWEPAYTSPTIRGGDKPLPVTVDCRSAVRIALLVDYGEWANRGDLANWLMARLTR